MSLLIRFVAGCGREVEADGSASTGRLRGTTLVMFAVGVGLDAVDDEGAGGLGAVVGALPKPGEE